MTTAQSPTTTSDPPENLNPNARKTISMNYRDTTYTSLVFTGNISKLKVFPKAIKTFLQENQGNSNGLLLMMNSAGGASEAVDELCKLLRRVKEEGHPLYVHILSQLSYCTYKVALEADLVIMEPSASLVFGQPTVSAKGFLAEMRKSIKTAQKDHMSFVQAIVQKSQGKLTKKQVWGWKDILVTAQQALKWGLCDIVLDRPAPVLKSDMPEYEIRFEGSFMNEDTVFNHMISLSMWLGNPENKARPIRLVLTSQGGTVSIALAFYGLLLEAQRQGHHLTMEIRKACSSALWFSTAAYNSGRTEIDRKAPFMFHAPWMYEVKWGMAEALQELQMQVSLYNQTRALLEMIPGFTKEVLDAWDKEGKDHEFDAETAANMGLGVLFDIERVYGAENGSEAPAV